LTSRLGESRVGGVEGYKNVWVRDLAHTSSAEPLDAMGGPAASLSLPCNDEGRSTGAGPGPPSGEILAYYAILYKATLSDPRASIVAGRTHTITVVTTFGDGRTGSASTRVGVS